MYLRPSVLFFREFRMLEMLFLCGRGCGNAVFVRMSMLGLSAFCSDSVWSSKAKLMKVCLVEAGSLGYVEAHLPLNVAVNGGSEFMHACGARASDALQDGGAQIKERIAIRQREGRYAFNRTWTCRENWRSQA